MSFTNVSYYSTFDDSIIFMHYMSLIMQSENCCMYLPFLEVVTMVTIEICREIVFQL